MSTSLHDDGPGSWVILAFAIACGATAANLYYAQPLIGPISQSFALDLSAAGLIVTMLQLGYVLGLVFLVPLGDLVENKRLILVAMGGVVVWLAVAALATQAWIFIVASLLIGITATAAQMILPVAAHLAPEYKRGQIVGTVMSGLLLGILLARPVSTLIAGELGWRVMYWISAAIMLGVLAMLTVALPRRHPKPGLSYGALIGSLWALLANTPVLKRRAAYQALLFGAFSLFWTAAPFLLQQPPFSLGPIALSLFLLSGAAGALIAPLAGRLADKGHGDAVTFGAIGLVVVCFVLTWIGGRGSLAFLVIAGILLDAGTQASLVIGQRAIYALPADIRSRLNAIYIALFFLGGAVGSALAGTAVTHGGFHAVALIGFSFAALTFILFTREYFGRSRER